MHGSNRFADVFGIAPKRGFLPGQSAVEDIGQILEFSENTHAKPPLFSVFWVNEIIILIPSRKQNDGLMPLLREGEDREALLIEIGRAFC